MSTNGTSTRPVQATLSAMAASMTTSPCGQTLNLNDATRQSPPSTVSRLSQRTVPRRRPRLIAGSTDRDDTSRVDLDCLPFQVRSGRDADLWTDGRQRARLAAGSKRLACHPPVLDQQHVGV